MARPVSTEGIPPRTQHQIRPPKTFNFAFPCNLLASVLAPCASTSLQPSLALQAFRFPPAILGPAFRALGPAPRSVSLIARLPGWLSHSVRRLHQITSLSYRKTSCLVTHPVSLASSHPVSSTCIGRLGRPDVSLPATPPDHHSFLVAQYPRAQASSLAAATAAVSRRRKASSITTS